MRSDKFDWAAAQWGKTKATNFFSKLATHLGSTGLDICMHKAKAHTYTEGVQIKPEQCNCNWLTQQQHPLRRSVRFRAVKQTLALHFLYCCHSRETEMATEVEAETPTETRLPTVLGALMYLYLSLSLPVSLTVDLPVALFFWSHCCCNLVTLCFIFITHTKLLHIKKVKFSVRFYPLPLLLLCFDSAAFIFPAEATWNGFGLISQQNKRQNFLKDIRVRMGKNTPQFAVRW